MNGLGLALFLAACGGGGGGDGTNDPCLGVDCGHGDCVADGPSAICACDPGYVADRLTCVPDLPPDIDGDGVPDQDDDCPAYPDPENDPATCESRLVVSGPTGNFVTALLQDGRVLLFGVYDEGTQEFVAEAWLYDPDDDSFVQTAGPPLGSHRGGAAATLADGRVVVVGGQELDESQLVELYDPASDSFAPGPDIPGAGFTTTVVVLGDGRVLIVGGLVEGGAGVPQVFDGSSFTAVDPLPDGGPANIGTAAVVLGDGRVLVTGGIDQCGSGSPGTPSDGVAIFDPAHDSWSLLPARLTAPRWMHGMSRLPDGRVLVFGGAHGICADNPLDFDASSSAEIFDPVAETFSAIPGETSEHLLGGTVGLADGTGYAVGGANVETEEPIADASRILADGVAESGPFAPGPLGQPRAWLYGSPILLQDGSVLVPGGSVSELERAPGVDRVFPYYDTVIDTDLDGIVDVLDAD